MTGSVFGPAPQAQKEDMHVSRGKSDDRCAALRGPPDPTLANLLRWERIKLWDAAQDAMDLIDDRAPATPEAAEQLWTQDIEFAGLVKVMRKHRARIKELQQMEAEATMQIALGTRPASET